MSNKKKRTFEYESIVLNIVTILFFNLLFWVCNLSTKHILEFNAWHSMFSVFFHLLFHGLFFYFLNSCCIQNKTLFSGLFFSDLKKPFVERLYVSNVVKMLVISVLSDALLVLLSQSLNEYVFILSEFLIVIKGFLYLPIMKGWKETVKKGRIFFAVAILLCAITVCMTVSDIWYLQELSSKLIPESVTFNEHHSNACFTIEIRGVILDTLMGIGVYAVCLRDFKGKISESAAFGRKAFFKLILRLTILFSLFLCVFFLKWGIYPYNSVGKVFRTWSDAGISRGFYDEDTLLEISKKTGYSSDEVCFKKRNVSIHHKMNPSTLVRYCLTSPVKDPYQSFEIGATTIEVFDNQAICYLENGVPKAVLLSDIVDQPQNDTLIQACQTMLADGNMVAFDYAGAYLKEHAPAFMEEYLLRYSKGEFTEQEQKYISVYNYREDYLMGVAKELLNNFEVAID